MPVRLRHNGHPKTYTLKKPTNNCRPESGVVNVSISTEKDDIKLLPAALLYFFLCGR